MTILGIETSCDETSAAIVEDGTKILSNIVSSSQEFHVKTGGIIPEVAAREQIKYLIPVMRQALQELSIRTMSHKPYAISQVDALAITIGPGLIGPLLVGVETAKALAYLWQKLIVPVNHLTAHLYANWLNHMPYAISHKPFFPAIALIASGGHTDLLLMEDHEKLKWLGGTRDDAAGEAFDKIARLLGLPYPGGPAIAAEAAKFKVKSSRQRRGSPKAAKLKVKLPRPMIDEENFDFSFSGLKTAVLREMNRLKTLEQWSNEAMEQLAYEVQEAITDVLVKKTLRAAQKYQVKSILLGGGVTANQHLREKLKLSIYSTPYTIHFPPAHLSTDNAAVVASCAYFNYKPTPWSKIQANPGLYF